MKIYTKTGDDGSTGLIGGTRVPKYHLRIESYGTVDELNAHLGIVCDWQKTEEAKMQLKEIQDRLFTVGSSLAADPEKSKMALPDLLQSDVEMLEKAMDKMNEVLPQLKNFIIPGGHKAVSETHIARCVCRRAERLVVHLSNNEKVEPLIVQYLNRLSDYLFVLARKTALDYKVEEIKWQSRT